jgi:Flp pilus assembly protein TadG
MLRFIAGTQCCLLRVRSWAPNHLFRILRQSEDGQAVVELALALPVLLIVVLGIVDFGRAVNYWNDETHLANLGARAAAVGVMPTSGPCSTSESTLTAFIQCQAGTDSSELKNGSGASTGVVSPVAVCVSIPKAAVGEPVTVKVSANYSWLPLPKVLGGSFKLATTHLSGTATMRLEQVPPSNFANTTAECK